jgi:hypothetical protein
MGYTLVKQASFIEEVLGTIKDKSRLTERPFETIFGSMLPMIVWPTSKILSILMFIAEALGYGPGLLGRLIDRYLGFGGTTAPPLTDTSLKSAATSVVDGLLAKLGLSAKTSMLQNFCMAKESIELNDMVAIAACIKYDGIIKEARRSPGRIGFLRRFLVKARVGGRLGLINFLWYLLKTFAKGLIGLGLIGGTIGYLKKKVKEVSPGFGVGFGRGRELGPDDDSGISTTLAPPERVFGKTELYLNTRGDVEETLIHFLDSAYKVRLKDKAGYKTFSEMFEELSGYPLRGSGEMRDVLKTIDSLNWGNVDQINMKRTFAAPTLSYIAKKLLPQIRLKGKRTGPQDKKELIEALRGVYNG